MDRVARYKYITEHAEHAEQSWTNAELARFHAYNPNGIYAVKKARDAEVSRLVNERGLPAGALVAYGSLNDYNSERLRKMATQTRVNKSRLHSVILGLLVDIEKAEEYIRENMFR